MVFTVHCLARRFKTFTEEKRCVEKNQSYAVTRKPILGSRRNSFLFCVYPVILQVNNSPIKIISFLLSYYE